MLSPGTPVSVALLSATKVWPEQPISIALMNRSKVNFLIVSLQGSCFPFDVADTAQSVKAITELLTKNANS